MRRDNAHARSHYSLARLRQRQSLVRDAANVANQRRAQTQTIIGIRKMRRAARIDRNQPDIIKALRYAGATVQPTHTLGKGCPDLLVGFRGENFLLEIKDGRKSPSHRKLTNDETTWI